MTQKKTFVRQARQGDIILNKVDNVDFSNLKKLERRNGRLIVAEGEVTGHHHAIDDVNTDLYLDQHGTMYIHAKEGSVADLVHDEHDTIHIPEGVYSARIQREYHPEEIRRVRD